LTSNDKKKLTYKDAGVDIQAGDKTVDMIKDHCRATFIPGVLSGIGGFGGLFSLKESGFEDPVMVSGTDGVGTKLKLAFALDIHDTVGIDAVAMCANDVVCCGARPLFFLDYLATGRLEPGKAADVVKGIAQGCIQAGCALIGGEMAEMPGFYADGEYDIAGFCVGAVERARMIDGSAVQPGHVVMGLPSSGVHSNGFSLVRKAIEVAGLGWTDDVPDLGTTLGRALLEPTRIYAKQVVSLIEQFDVRGIAHITGGGLEGNIVRVLPHGAALAVDWDAWPRHKIFDVIQNAGNIEEAEMRRVFNLGVGLAVIVPADQARAVMDAARDMLGMPAYRIARVTG
jgi:phosphoribosylformylglycinamidine cyclo-ligase